MTLATLDWKQPKPFHLVASAEPRSASVPDSVVFRCRVDIMAALCLGFITKQNDKSITISRDPNEDIQQKKAQHDMYWSFKKEKDHSSCTSI